MRTLLLGAALALVPAAAIAEDQNLPAVYLEGAIGGSFIPTVQTNTVTLTDGVNTATGHASLNYSDALTESGEIGVEGVGIPEIRIGVDYDHLEARFENGVVSGTLDGVAGSLPFTRADLPLVGFSQGALDTNVNVGTVNAYYSPVSLWMTQETSFTPYVGVGVGEAWLSQAGNKFAFTATAGFRVTFEDQAYVGVRYRYYNINGPSDALGVPFDAITDHTIMVLVGVYWR